MTTVSDPTLVVPEGAEGTAAAHDAPAGVWAHHHLLDVDVLSADDLELVMRTTDTMAGILARPIPKVPTLRGWGVTILFYEASTRTRVSFEVAAKNLLADVVTIAAASSSVTKGESLIDTIRTLEALGARMLVMRHSPSGAPYLASGSGMRSGPRSRPPASPASGPPGCCWETRR